MKPSWFVSQLGSRERYAIARALYQRDREVRLFTDRWSRLLADRFDDDFPSTRVSHVTAASVGFDLMSRLTGKHGWQLIENRNAWFSKQAVRALTGGECPEFVFSYSYTALETFEKAKQMGCRTVLGQIDPGPEEQRLVADIEKAWGVPVSGQPTEAYWKNWQRECDLADSIVVNSEWSRDLLVKSGVQEDKIVVIALAYELAIDVTEVHAAPNRPLQVLFLGQLIPRKGILETIDAIKSNPGLDVEWTFVGDGPAYVTSELAGLPNVRVVGSVSPNQVSTYYREADVFLLPTHSDGFAITQLEAMAHGVPVIASKNCGRAVVSGENGIVLNEVSSSALSLALGELADDRTRLNEMKENLRSGNYRFGLDRLGAQLLALEGELHSNA